MRVIFLCLVVMLAIPQLTNAASYQRGLEAYNKGDYKTALVEWQPLAQQGISETVFNLGPVNTSHLIREQHNAMAQFNLGVIYLKGQGVVSNKVESHYWFNLAASQLQNITQKRQAATMRDDLAKKMTHEEIAVAQRKFKIWKPTLMDNKENKFAPFGRGH